MEFSSSRDRILRCLALSSERPGGALRLGHHLLAAFALIMFSWATAARADPCEGQPPSSHGQKFEGVVRYVGDGDSLCVGQSPDPQTWIEVRLADFDAPELHTPQGPIPPKALELSRCSSRLHSATLRDAKPAVGEADVSSPMIGSSQCVVSTGGVSATC